VTNLYSRKEDEGSIWEEFVDYGCNEDSYIQVFIWDMN
jgi:hypothetical protein